MAERRTLTRADLAEAARLAVGVDMGNAKALVGELLEAIAGELVRGSGRVKVSRFGAFVVHRAPERVGRNPKRPDEAHAIPAHSRVAFRPSLELRARVDGKSTDV